MHRLRDIFQKIETVSHNTIKNTLKEKHLQEVSCKKMFLKISQNSKGNSCASLFFNKVTGSGL